MKRYLAVINIITLLFGLINKSQAQTQTVANGQNTSPVNFPATGCIYTWTNDKPEIGLPANGSGNINSFAAINTSNSVITATITVTPVTAGYAYVTSFGSNTVYVINTATNAVVATVPVGSFPDDVSVSPDGSRVYVGNFVSNTVSVINTATNLVIKTISVGSSPQGITVSPDGSRVYVANNTSNDVSVIDAVTDALIKTIPVGIGPRGICISPDGSKVYVTDNTSNFVTVISTTTNTVLISIPTGLNPAGISVSPDGSRLYVANQTSNDLSVINTVSNAVVATILVGSNPFGLSVSPNGSYVYVSNLNSSNVSVINTQTNKLLTTIEVGGQPQDNSVSQDGTLLYVVNSEDYITIISTATNAVIATLQLGSIPKSFGVKPGTNCTATPVTFTITVNPASVTPPNIIAGTVSGNISACAGTSSTFPNIQQFTVSGSNLTANIIATAPTGFEVSLTTSSGYGNSVILNQSGGTVNNTVVYVRSAASAPVGNISGNVTLASSGATSQNVAVTGIVNALPTVNTVANQVVNNGATTTAINFTGTGNTFNWVNNTSGIGLAANGTGNIASFTAINTGNSPVLATITATPVSEGYAYITNSADGTVSAINTTTDKVESTIKVGLRPEGVAVSPDGSRVYVTNTKSNSVSVINNRSVISTIPVGILPEGIAVSPDGSRIYVVNSGSNTISVINTTTNGVIANIQVSTASTGVAVSPDGSWVYVTNQSSSAVSVINATTNVVIATIPVGDQPYDLVVSPDGSRVYVANVSSSSVSVINATTNVVVSTIGINSNAEGIAISPDGSKVYIAGFFSNTIEVINTATNTVVSTITTSVQPSGISLSSDGEKLYVANSGSNTVTVINTTTNSIISTIPVGSDPLSRGNFITTGTNCSGIPVTFTITVNPTLPTAITATGSPMPLNTTYGTASASTSFIASGSNMTTGILVTPPPGFEISTDDINYSSTVTVGGAGNIVPTTVYIRLASSTPVGDYSGNIVLSSTGAGNVNVPMPNCTVTPASLTIRADNKSKIYLTVNPDLTVSYTGFVNNDTQLQLTTPPVIITTALTTSPVGEYPIIASKAVSTNYTITYVPGVLTINQTSEAIIIPNTFTPNGDGINDTWNIKNLESYLNCTVQIYNRYGENVYSSIGYGVSWDGKYKGVNLPTGTYYYIINLKNGYKALSGFVAIIR